MGCFFFKIEVLTEIFSKYNMPILLLFVEYNFCETAI